MTRTTYRIAPVKLLVAAIALAPSVAALGANAAPKKPYLGAFDENRFGCKTEAVEAALLKMYRKSLLNCGDAPTRALMSAREAWRQSNSSIPTCGQAAAATSAFYNGLTNAVLNGECQEFNAGEKVWVDLTRVPQDSGNELMVSVRRPHTRQWWFLPFVFAP